MDREQMIEEMANDIPAEMKDPYQGSDITVLYSYQRRKQIAKCLVTLNYRKIPEGAVVLTKEEYDRFEKTKNDTIQKMEEYIKGLIELEKEKESIRKETKMEVLKKLNGFRFVMYDEDEDGEEYEVASWTCEEEDVEKFAKEIGVEVE